MGTKNQPGDFDCYANANPDEPMFIFLARDGMAPSLVEAWANARERAGESPAKVAEARACAQAMRVWLKGLGKVESPITAYAVLTECITAAWGATCFDVLEDAQNDLADPNRKRYSPEGRAAILRGERMCAFCRNQRERELLKEAHKEVCSNLCPSVWKTGEDQPHSDLCKRISSTLSAQS